MKVPRFLKHNLNPRLVQEDIGDAFQAFVHETLRADYPDLHLFPTRGKDGVIDLSQTEAEAEVRTIVECKFISEDGLTKARRRWREVTDKLATHLVAPDGPAKYHAQYGPWYRVDPRVKEFVFCISSVLSNQEQFDQLQQEIAQFFHNLSEEHEHLAHLRELSIRVLDWNDLCTRLRQQPHILFRWFPITRPQGLVPLAEAPDQGTFRSYLTSEKLPYYSRRRHLGSMPSPGVEIPDEEGLLGLFEDRNTTGLVVTGSGGVGKTRLTQEIARLAEDKRWLVLRVKSRLREDALERLTECVTPDMRVLLLFDYIETQRDFAEVEQTLNDLNDTYLLQLHYVASCRTSYYYALPASSRRRRVDLSPFVQDSEQSWLQGYRHETVRHILEHSGIEVTDKHFAICRDIPIFAVFVSYLHSMGREADLAELLNETDFGTWVSKRVQLSFVQPAINRDLALLTAMLSMPADLFSRMDQDRFGALLDILATDGWIEQLPANEFEGSAAWTTAHDVVADQINLDNESLELILVGYAITIAAEAGQIFRPVAWADWGIDGEIEFKDHEGKASGQRVYLQLKSGDSYLYHRKRDDVEVFTIKNPRHVEYWLSQAYPVMLVIRTSDGKIRWMNVTDYLQRHGPDTRQIVFEGEPFTALNVARLRDRVLAASEMRR